MTIVKKNISFDKVGNRIKSYYSKPENIISTVFTVLLVSAVLLPLCTFLIDSFIVHSGEVRRTGLSEDSLTLQHWNDILFNEKYDYSKAVFWNPLKNSLIMAMTSCLLSVFIGGFVAYFVTRTDLVFKKFISVVFIFPYIMPSWSIAMFWENFFKNSGVDAAYNQVGMLESLTGIRVPESMVYGYLPMAMCLGIHYAPFAYILIGGILRNMDANLEEAAVILRASRLKILRKVTLPIVMPALISTVLLVFASSMSSYTVPAFLNKNNSFNVLSIQMKSNLTASGTMGQGFSIAVVMILLSIVIMSINNLYTGKRKSFTTVTGKSGQVSLVKLKSMRYVIATIIALYVTFIALTPLLSFALESFLYTPGDYSTLTLDYWLGAGPFENRVSGSSAGILRNSTIWMAYARTLLLSLIVSLIAGTFGILIGYSVARKRKSNLSNFLGSLAFFPYLIPAISFGAIYLSLSYTSGFTWLNGSFILLVLVGSIKFLPFASRSGTNAMMQLSGEIEEAAVLVGTPWIKRMTRILFPIQKSSFISGYLLPFSSCMREMTLFVLIASSGSILTVVLEDFTKYGVQQIANGINLIIITSVLMFNLIINKLTGASVDKGVGG